MVEVAEKTEIEPKLTEQDLRLVRAVRKAQKHCEEVERQRQLMLDELCGLYFDGSGPNGKYVDGVLQDGSGVNARGLGERDRQLAMVFTTIITLRPLLAIDPLPKFGYTSTGLDVFARIFERGVKHRFNQANLNDVMRDFVVQALFGQGILVSGVAPDKVVGNLEEATGYLDDPGKFYVRCIDAKDFVYDSDARTWDTCKFMGHYQDVPKAFATGCELYDPDQVELIEPIEAKLTGGDEKRIPNIYDEIKLLHLYLPQTREIVTLPGDLDEIEKVGILSRRPYEGPEEGPYDRTSFLDKPGTVKPISIVSTFIDLHRAANDLAAKFVDRAINERDFPTGNFGDKKQLESMADAKDGDGILSLGGTIDTVKVGGVSQAMLASSQQVKEWYNDAAMNAEVLGGLGPQSQTAAQDQQLLDSAGIKMSDLQGMIIKVAKSLCQKAAYWLWHDEFDEFPLNTGLPDDGVFEQWEPDYREGTFDDYNFDIAVFVGQADTTNERYARKSKFVQDIIMGLAPFAQLQGKEPNVDKITRELGGDQGIDDPDDFWVEVQQELPQQGIQAGSRGGDNTTINTGQGTTSKTPLETASVGLE